MIKCHLVKLGNSFDSIGEGHACKDLITGYALGQMDCDNGYFLTDSDLKRVAQEAFEAARASYKELDIGYEEITYITFDDYWTEQQARKGEG
jgi:hypothetical protein